MPRFYKKCLLLESLFCDNFFLYLGRTSNMEKGFYSLSLLCGFLSLWLKKCKSLCTQALAKDKPQREETTEEEKRERDYFSLL